ncbi:hypothetical protein OKW96_12395 [Sphingobacterium sp. KU25419]|nr:hypothetical protein OKW96_12395 [Sphingobacterium sp. KU25419]
MFEVFIDNAMALFFVIWKSGYVMMDGQIRDIFNPSRGMNMRYRP